MAHRFEAGRRGTELKCKRSLLVWTHLQGTGRQRKHASRKGDLGESGLNMPELGNPSQHFPHVPKKLPRRFTAFSALLLE